VVGGPILYRALMVTSEILFIDPSPTDKAYHLAVRFLPCILLAYFVDFLFIAIAVGLWRGSKVAWVIALSGAVAFLFAGTTFLIHSLGLYSTDFVGFLERSLNYKFTFWFNCCGVIGYVAFVSQFLTKASREFCQVQAPFSTRLKLVVCLLAVAFYLLGEYLTREPDALALTLI